MGRRCTLGFSLTAMFLAAAPAHSEMVPCDFKGIALLADVVGYSRLMSVDEEGTHAQVRFASDLYGAFPVKRLFLGFAASSLFGAGKAVLRPVACDQVRGTGDKL